MHLLIQRLRFLVPLIVLGIALFTLSAAPVRAAGVVGNGTPASCTQAAFTAAMNGGGKVKFNCGANPFTLTLTSLYTVTANTTIDGGNKITLAAQNNSLFTVAMNRSLTLKKITLRNGKASGAGAIYNFGTLSLKKVTLTNNQATTNGGAIMNQGTLAIANSTLSSNKAVLGGAIYNVSGTVTISDSELSQNQGTNGGGAIYLSAGQVTLVRTTVASNEGFDGGALYVNAGSTLTIQDSTVDGNTGNYGGAIENNGTVNVARTSFGANTAQGGDGGAIWNLSGSLTIEDANIHDNIAATTGGGISNYGNSVTLKRVTFESNSAAGQGGGMYNTGAAALENVTFGKNETGTQGGAYYSSDGTSSFNFVTIKQNSSITGAGGIHRGGGTVNVRNTVIDFNTGGGCAGTVTSLGHNFSYDATCTGFTKPGDNGGFDPQLAPLQRIGGYGSTFIPEPTSQLLEQGVSTGTPNIDQRGVPRPQPTFGAPDIGAVERCGAKPGKPQLVSPAKGATVTNARVTVDWDAPVCGVIHGVQVYQDAKNGNQVETIVVLSGSEATTKRLAQGHTYFWRVIACNEMGCKNSKWRFFTVP